MPINVDSLHNVSCFISALASACEKNLGGGSLSICFLAGKKFGSSVVENHPAVSDPITAIECLKKALAQRGIVWEFEPFAAERSSLPDTGKKRSVIRLVFYSCMVRNALFRYGHEQKQSLCHMSHGVFAGAMEKILKDTKATLEIIHAGPNGCLKELILEEVS